MVRPSTSSLCCAEQQRFESRPIQNLFMLNNLVLLYVYESNTHIALVYENWQIITKYSQIFCNMKKYALKAMTFINLMEPVLILYNNPNPYNIFTNLNECLKWILIITCLQIYKYILFKLCPSLRIDNQIMYEYVSSGKLQIFRSSLII